MFVLFLIFIDDEEGKNILSFVFNVLAMQYILQMNCVPYILDGDEDKIIKDIRNTMLISFIKKSEKDECLTITSIIFKNGLPYY